MPVIHVSSPLKMKTIRLTKSGKAKQAKKSAAQKEADEHLRKYDAVEALRDDVTKLCELYWDNGGFLDDAPLDEFIEKIHSLVRK